MKKRQKAIRAGFVPTKREWDAESLASTSDAGVSHVEITLKRADGTDVIIVKVPKSGTVESVQKAVSSHLKTPVQIGIKKRKLEPLDPLKLLQSVNVKQLVYY
jgi:hypothetical protein